MWWIIDTGGHRGSEIKEMLRWFDMDEGRKVRIMETIVVQSRSEKMEKLSLTGGLIN